MRKIREDRILIIRAFLDDIALMSYVIVKLETPSYHKLFPKIIYEGTDIDILTNEERFSKIVSNAKSLDLAAMLFLEEKHGNVKVRFEDEKGLLIQFDVLCFSTHLPIKYINKILERSEFADRIKVANPIDELVLRLEAIYNSPKKLHHYLFVLKNFHYLFFLRSLIYLSLYLNAFLK